MNIFGKLYPQKKHADDLSQRSIDKLFESLRSLINREDFIENAWSMYVKAGTMRGDQRLWLYVDSYRLLEQFICSNKPFVVKDEYTKESLHKYLVQKTIDETLPEELKVLALEKPLSLAAFFTVITKPYCLMLSQVISDEVFEKFSSPLNTTQAALWKFVAHRGIVCHHDAETDCQVPKSLLFRHVFRLMYDETSHFFGDKTANGVLHSIFFHVEQSYGASWVTILFDMVPETLLVQERLSVVSQVDIETRVKEETESERLKAEQARVKSELLQDKVIQVESQNSFLEQNKRAMLNLLEDARELERKLETERDRARAIISTISEGLFVVNEREQITIMNAAAEELLNLASGEAINKHWFDVLDVYKGDQSITRDAVSPIQSLDVSQHARITLKDDMYFQTKKNKRFPVSISTAVLENNDKKSLIVVFADITAEKEQFSAIEKEVQIRTAQLRQEQARLKASIESLTVGFILTDLSSTVLSINAIASNIFRNELSKTLNLEALDRRFTNGISLTELVANAVKSRTYKELKEVQIESRILHIVVTPVMEDATNIIGAVIWLEDITEEKILQRSKDEFFSIASHELRTPLTAIRGNTSMLKEYYASIMQDPDVKEMLNDIHESSIRLIDIVNDFLDISKIEQGKMEFKKDTFDIVNVLRECLKEYEHIAQQAGNTLSLNEPGAGRYIVIGDESKTKQVLTNLIGNSIKFTDHGTIHLEAHTEDGFIKVVVADTGRGISPENQNLLFHKFQQANTSLLTRDTTKGTGLGLYISKKMIEGMGGTIQLDYSKAGEGTAFSFRLPRKQ